MENSQTFYTEKQKYESSSYTAREVLKGYYGHTLTAKDGVLLKHNVEPYAKLLRALLTQNGTALINHATGTGKSYIVAKYLIDGFLDTKKPILFLGPNNSVLANFENTLVGILGKDYKKHLNITFSTYQNPKRYVDKSYSCIICDEAHHIGAKEWLKYFQNLISNNIGADVIGLTATMERTDNFDITKIFGNPISRLPVLDAYTRGILIPPLYTLWQIRYNKYGEETDDLTARIQELQSIGKDKLDVEGKKEVEHLLDVYKQVQRKIPTDDNLGDIISKSLDTASKKLGRDLKKGKIIVFCPPGVNEATSERYIESIAKDCKLWLWGAEMNQYVMHSNLPERENEKTLQQFRDDKSDKLRIMFNIGMLTEGVHVSGIDAVVMLRPTNSSIVYLQQLGRISSAKSTTNLVIDCVCNAINMSNGDFYTNISNMLSTALGDEKESDDDKSDDKPKSHTSIEFFVDQSQEDILKLLQNANMEYQNFRAEYFLSPAQELIKYIPLYMAQHPENCARDENGRLKLKEQIKQNEVLTLENGEKYHIGQQVSQARRGRLKMTEDERKTLEDFGIDFARQKNINPAQTLIKMMPLYMEQHPENCARGENGRLKLKEQIKRDEVLILENGEVYLIGKQVSRARLGEITMSEDERKKLEDFGIDFARRIDKNPAQTLIKMMPLYTEQHPEKCAVDKNGVLKLKKQIKQSEVLTLENGEEYPIGRQVSQARLGKMKMTEEERKTLEDFGIDFARQIDKNPAQTLIKMMPLYMEQHPEKCAVDKNGVLKLKKQIPQREVLKLENGEEYRIGQQVSRARLGEMKMTEEEHKKLEDFGIDFNVKRQVSPNIGRV